jgi:hypothetical protein
VRLGGCRSAECILNGQKTVKYYNTMFNILLLVRVGKNLLQNIFLRDLVNMEMAAEGDGGLPEYYSDLANYEIERKIGRGQFSVVFRARCMVDGRVVALKKVQVGRQEARALAALLRPPPHPPHDERGHQGGR